jgi:hypothetical protein
MVSYTPTPSTLKPAEVAVVMVEQAVAKHRTRADVIFLKGVRLLASLRIVIPLSSYNDVTTAQFFAGVMLSYGGLLSEVLQGGAAGLTQSNPGIVKILGGFVFPVGLVM